VIAALDWPYELDGADVLKQVIGVTLLFIGAGLFGQYKMTGWKRAGRAEGMRVVQNGLFPPEIWGLWGGMSVSIQYKQQIRIRVVDALPDGLEAVSQHSAEARQALGALSGPPIIDVRGERGDLLIVAASGRDGEEAARVLRAARRLVEAISPMMEGT